MIAEFKYAFRKLAKTPGFTLGIVLILALAIGANVAEFSFTDAVLVKPLAWPHADRLVYIWNTSPHNGWPIGPVSVPDYFDRKRLTEVFDDAGLIHPDQADLTTGARPEQISILDVTPSLFSTLGIRPLRGRNFTADERLLGRNKVAIITYEMWQAKFEGRENTLGDHIRLNGEDFQIVGILPKNFASLGVGWSSFSDSKAQIWVPLAFASDQLSDRARGNWSYIMIARLRAGVTVAQAQEQVDGIQRNRAAQFKRPFVSRQDGGGGGIVVGYREHNVQGVRPILLILQAAVALVLLIACANVANLMLARATARRKEIAIRLALGAKRFHLVSQFLAESYLLVAMGCGLGVFAAASSLKLTRWLPGNILPNQQVIDVDRTALLLTLLVALGCGLFFGLTPLAFLLRPDPDRALTDANTRGSAGRSTISVRAALIVAEVAFAMMLLVAAGLTVKSFAKLQRVDPGFGRENILTATVSLPPSDYQDPAAQSTFFAEALRRIRALPAVKSAGAILFAPFSGNSVANDYIIKGFVQEKGQLGLNARCESVDPQYFPTMKIPLLRGRFFSNSDSANAMPVVIIDQFLAHRWFADRNPIGFQISLRYPTGGPQWCTIAGVVGDVKTDSVADPIAKETLYFPLAQRPVSTMTLVLKTEIDPTTLIAPLREVVRQLNPELPVYGVQTMNQLLADSMAGYRLPMAMLTAFGATALALASLGLYSVLAYSVSQRTREIGIRIALGAQDRAILGMVVGQGFRLTLIGSAVGLAASLALTHFLRSVLYDVSTVDPETYAAIPFVLTAVALLACYLPARRATKVDPMIALRAE